MPLKVKTFKSFFVFDDDDWIALSHALHMRFPQAIYISFLLKNSTFASMSVNEPIRYWQSLEQFQEENHETCIMRDPWPEDWETGADIDLIGGFDWSRFTRTEAGFHRFGRGAEISRYRRNVGNQAIATCLDSFQKPAIERIGSLPASAYGDAKFYFHEHFSSFRVWFNEYDPPLKQFAYEIRRIVQQVGTRSVALYNPSTGEVLDPSYHTAKSLIGWNLLRKIHDGTFGYLMMPWNLDDVSDVHPRRDGIAALIGPRPGHPKVQQWSGSE